MAGRISEQRVFKRRIGLRWSLRSLLILVTLSAVAARFVGAEILAYDAEQGALAALNKVGSVRPDSPYKSFY